MTMEDLVMQLREQHAILTTYLRDQRNKHEDEVIELEEKQEDVRKQIVAQHEAEKEKLKKEHEEYVSLLQRHHKSINAMIEKSYLEKIRHLRNEYALLQAALRNYKQAVRCDISKSVYALLFGRILVSDELLNFKTNWYCQIYAAISTDYLYGCSTIFMVAVENLIQ